MCSVYGTIELGVYTVQLMSSAVTVSASITAAARLTCTAAAAAAAAPTTARPTAYS